MTNYLKAAALAAALWMLPAAAMAQSSPGWPFNYVPTTAEWNAVLAGKTDYTGSPAITAAGGTFTGKVNFLASSSGTAGMNCGVGTAPSSPVNGDLWCTTTGAFARINGSTVQLGGAGINTVPNGGTGQASFTANLPLIGAGASAIAQGTVTSTNASTLFATASGVPVNGNCASWNNGNVIDNGSACTAVSSGAVSAGTANQLGYYAGAGSTISGLATANNGVLITSGGGVPSISSTLPSAVQANITATGALASGSLAAGFTPVTGALGGTGVANTGLTITLGGNFATSGAAVTLTAIGATNVTLPTSGNIMNQNGTSGGVPYYNSSTTVLSSGALTANLPVFGGGAGAAPFVGTRTGTTTELATYTGSAPTNTHCAQWDASGNLTDSGATCAGASGGAVLLVTLNCGSGTPASCTDINSSCPAASSTTGCFSNTYLNYQVVLTNLVPTTPANNLGCQVHVYNSGGTYQVTGYKATSITTYIPCYGIGSGGGAGNLAAPGVSGSFTVFNPSASAKSVWVSNTFGVNGGSNGFISQTAGGGYWDTNAVIVGFRACFGTTGGTCSGTIASGTIKVYGLP